MLIGKSLSFCVKDILDGLVDINDVACIITGTKIENDERWERIILQYSGSYWRRFNEEAIRYYISKLKSRIVQPRLHGMNGPNIADRKHWIETD